MLLSLPCKVGDKFYRVVRTCSFGGCETIGDFFPTGSDCEKWCCSQYANKQPCDAEYMILEDQFQTLESILYRIKDIGVSYFLSEDEAKEERKKIEEFKKN